MVLMDSMLTEYMKDTSSILYHISNRTNLHLRQKNSISWAHLHHWDV